MAGPGPEAPGVRAEQERSHGPDVILPLARAPLAGAGPVLIVGASTGGTDALKMFLGALPADAPPVLVAQHMPAKFTRTFARRLDAQCVVRVHEAEGDERLLPGHVWLAPGHSHLMLARGDGHYRTALSAGPPVNRHRPSVDVLFRSAANVAGRSAVGVILTGMGRDGAAGLLEMRQAGAWTIAQDESSCVVFGMPREAIALGAAREVLPIDQMAERVMACFRRTASTRPG